MQSNPAQPNTTQQLSFSLKQWAYWQSAPIAHQQGWPRGTILPSDDSGSPDIQFLPMMQRRRLSPLAKAACAVAWRCQQSFGNMPTVFFSVHGESHYYLEMLQDMAKGEAVSPSRFSLCVHNAIAGLFSFQAQNTLPYVSLAGGCEGILGAFMEARGLLLEAPQVMLICYEQVLPLEYQSYSLGTDKTWALALVLGHDTEAEPLKLQWLRTAGKPLTQSISSDSVFADAIVTGQYSGSMQFAHTAWSWELRSA
jgi:hypothetical protein